METEDEIAKKYVKKTYGITFAMLIVGQAQIIITAQMAGLRRFMEEYYYVSLIEFFVSFLSLQLYVFFFNTIQSKKAWIRALCALWTYEANTICIIQPTIHVEYITLGVSFALVYIVMILSIMYSGGRNRRYLNRSHLILWSERIFVITSFGIIVCSDMNRIILELLMLLFYTIISNVFVLIFASSIRSPEFFGPKSNGWLLFGQLYYLNFYVLFNCYIWTIASVKELIISYS